MYVVENSLKYSLGEVDLENYLNEIIDIGCKVGDKCYIIKVRGLGKETGS